MSALLPVDAHAHIDPSIAPRDLEELQAVIFAMTRSLTEAETALNRNDSTTVWGVGTHPGLAGALGVFREERFAALLDKSPLVGEVGLDGKSKVPLDKQCAVLSRILKLVQSTPRIVSLHSFAATDRVLQELDLAPISGAVLHWWLGDEVQTKKAVDLGCFFSVNIGMARRPDVLRGIPVDRLLTETDHPAGNKSGRLPRRPGEVSDIEAMIAQLHSLEPQDIRLLIWRNLLKLTSQTDTWQMLPRLVRVRLGAL
jgi:TatD DNase family protein